MLRPAVLGILLACAVSLSSSAVILEDGMPILWAHTAAQLTDLPVQNDVLTPDPWHYLHRMTFYRLMIAATDPFMGSMGPNATENPLWGLALQLGWMLTSGRFADPSGATTCGLQTGDTMCISTHSWWSCVSYFTSALPFLSAAQQGFMGAGVQVQMQVPAGEDYCTKYDDCASRYPDVMTKWNEFFQGLKSSVDSPLPDNEKKDVILGLYWEAQKASIYASAACNAKQSQYSSQEVSFSKDWLGSVEYVSAARFQSSLDRAPVFLASLPSRVLQAGDNAPNIADLSVEENQSLYVFSWMNSINSLLGGSLVTMWKGAMCSVATREKGRDMLGQLMVNPSYATSTFMTIVTGMSTGC